jgi:hypothetical protein
MKKFLQPLRKGSSKKTKVFNITAGSINCPESCRFLLNGKCIGLNGPSRFPCSVEAFRRNSEATRDLDRFEREMTAEIQRSRVECVRPHGSAGEFWDIKYMIAWFNIAGANPDKHFYAYTKRISWVIYAKRTGVIPANWTFIMSSGSDQDGLIDKERDRHTAYFKTVEDMQAAGYVNVSNDDSLAWSTPSNKIGLLLKRKG